MALVRIEKIKVNSADLGSNGCQKKSHIPEIGYLLTSIEIIHPYSKINLSLLELFTLRLTLMTSSILHEPTFGHAKHPIGLSTLDQTTL